MVFQRVCELVDDVYDSFRFRGWTKLRNNVLKVSENEKNKSLWAIRKMASDLSKKGRSVDFRYDGLSPALASATSVSDIHEICAVIYRIAEMMEPPAWNTACQGGYLAGYVRQAREAIRKEGDFFITHKYTPPTPFQHEVEEVWELGGTGCNARGIETRMVTKTGVSSPKLEVLIGPVEPNKYTPAYSHS